MHVPPKTAAALLATATLVISSLAAPGAAHAQTQAESGVQWEALIAELEALQPGAREALAYRADYKEVVSLARSGSTAHDVAAREWGWQDASGAWANQMDVDATLRLPFTATLQSRTAGGQLSCEGTCGKPTPWARVPQVGKTNTGSAVHYVKLAHDSVYLAEVKTGRQAPAAVALGIATLASTSDTATLFSVLSDSGTTYTGAYFDPMRNGNVSFTILIAGGEVTRASYQADIAEAGYRNLDWQVTTRFTSRLVEGDTRNVDEPARRGLRSPGAWLDWQLRDTAAKVGAKAAALLNKKAQAQKVTVDNDWLVAHLDQAVSDAAKAMRHPAISVRYDVHPLAAIGEAKILVDHIGITIPDFETTARRAVNVSLAVSEGKVKVGRVKTDDTFPVTSTNPGAEVTRHRNHSYRNEDGR